MTDLEITKLCAEAMGVRLVPEIYRGKERYRMTNAYDPIHNDAQAMSLDSWLLERGAVHIQRTQFEFFDDDRYGATFTIKADIGNPRNCRRARAECVARMQKEKRK